MESIIQDIRYAVRTLRKRPGFTAAALLTLALGIGANTAIFTVVNGVLLKPLPYDAPDQLVRIWGVDRTRGPTRRNISPQDFLDWREQARSFEEIAAFTDSRETLTGDGEPERVRIGAVTHGYFRALRMRPALGRTFAPEDDLPDAAAPVAVLSYEMWRTRFGGEPDIIGRTITINGDAVIVIGVAASDFRPPPSGTRLVARHDLWLPLGLGPSRGRGGHWLTAIGRLQPGVTLDQAQAEMDAITVRLEQEYPNSNAGWGVRLEPLRGAIVGDVRKALLVLFGAVGFVLLIASANLSNLLLIHASGKRRELALRAAIGAGRPRIVRQLLTESLVLSALGGAAGLLLAIWLSEALVGLGASAIPRVGEIGVDVWVLAFTAGVTLLIGIMVGLIPARLVSRPDLTATLSAGTRGSASSASRQRIQGVLVVSQIALALMLLIGAGLMIKSFRTLQAVDPGFDRDGVLTFDLALLSHAYPERPQVVAFYQELQERLEALPGVHATGSVSILPLRGWSCDGFEIEGRPWASPAAAECAEFRVVSGDYFGALGIARVRGRIFDERDHIRAPRVAVINEAMARRYWSGQDPIGKRLQYGDLFEIVGVVSDIRQLGLDSEPLVAVYLDHRQYPFYRELTVAVGTLGAPSSAIGAVRAEIRAMDPDLPLSSVSTMSQLLSRSVAKERFRTLLLGLFAALAAALAVIGIYGVISYSVAQRTYEIGVRIALGARAEDVLRHVMRSGLKLALLGIGFGLLGAYALTRVLANLLFEVSVTDPPVFAVVTLLLGGVALAATYVPGNRATKIDPVEALRHE
ncbi:MAG: ABC transporter permease [Candidatus Palauibacterales bacterium]|nr:ABC transporter permease [Candidatus Palauibacterales bacterium]